MLYRPEAYWIRALVKVLDNSAKLRRENEILRARIAELEAAASDISQLSWEQDLK